MQSIIASWKHPKVKDIRGKGLMLGVDIEGEARPLLEAAIAGKPGLLLLTAGKQTLRLLPPYTISDSEIEEGLEILKKLL